jgi:hypothetical protein
MSLYLAGIPFKLNFGFTFIFLMEGVTALVTFVGLRLGKVLLFTFWAGRMRV